MFLLVVGFASSLQKFPQRRSKGLSHNIRHSKTFCSLVLKFSAPPLATIGCLLFFFKRQTVLRVNVEGASKCLKKIRTGNSDLLSWIKKTLLSVCDKIDEHEKSKDNRLNERLLFVSIGDDCVYVNDEKIVDKKAKLQFAIFRILLDSYVEEFFSGESQYASIQRIDFALKSKGFILEDPENQICGSIYRIRASIKSADKRLTSDSIIESKKWEGYRINDRVFLKKFGVGR
jgi:hypothetical protein